MAAFNVKTHASRSGLGDHETEPPAVLNFRRPPSVDQPPASEEVDFAKLLDEPEQASRLPDVVLRLPDLDADEPETPSRPFRLGPALYWAAIVVGAALAVWLIFFEKKPAERATEEAPRWNPSEQQQQQQQQQEQKGEPDPAGSHHGPHGHAPRARVVGIRGTSGDANQEVGVNQEAGVAVAPADGVAPFEVAPTDGQPTEPAWQPETGAGTAESAAGVNSVRMARTDEPPPGVPASKPSEATPLGISTTVTE